MWVVATRYVATEHGVTHHGDFSPRLTFRPAFWRSQVDEFYRNQFETKTSCGAPGAKDQRLSFGLTMPDLLLLSSGFLGVFGARPQWAMRGCTKHARKSMGKFCSGFPLATSSDF